MLESGAGTTQVLRKLSAISIILSVGLLVPPRSKKKRHAALYFRHE
jgi:hypothetical protein